MMDYVKGGTKLNFMCAIDFTMSNRHPTDPTSLHHTAPGAFNEYEQAIAAIGGIIMEYDEDKMIPTYGFGLKPAPGVPAEHCWPLTYDHARPEVHGVQVRYRMENL